MCTLLLIQKSAFHLRNMRDFYYFCKNFFDIMTNLKSLQNFVQNWTGKGYEKGESQPFWIALLEALGVENATQFIEFEAQVHIDHTAFIDGFIHSTKVLIEQKSVQKELGSPIKQSDGSLLNPFQQAKRYAAELPYSERPRWIVTCNFREFWVYDMEQPHAEPQKIFLQDLEKEHYRLKFLVDQGNEQLKREMELSIKAGDLVGKIYDAILPQYSNPESPETLQSLNQLCVRLVFCLFAEDAGLFGDRNEFHDYLAQYPASKIRLALIQLFKIFDTPLEKRDTYLDDDLKIFPYVNGGLFSNEDIEIPQFTEDIKKLILTKASEDFDWSEISPTIFGAVFESTLNPVTRRTGGMHYTSIENIHKVIDPLFMDSLNEEFSKCETKKQLIDFQNKLANLKFLDPACGSGNFLTESYISLRRLENKIIQKLQGGQTVLGDISNPIKVDIHQFYGIEINDFAVSVATTALWIAELQMMRETEKIASFNIDPLPLKSYHNIKEGNALKLSWTEWEEPNDIQTIYAKKAHICRYQQADENTRFYVNEAMAVYGNLNLIAEKFDCNFELPKSYHVDFDYIMGNPPFVGQAMRTKEQAADIQKVFAPLTIGGKLDYVSGWYKKASDVMKGTNIETAFVSSNSICQGESVNLLWEYLLGKGIVINFAHTTFKWESESDDVASVMCVVVGFSFKERQNKKLFVEKQGKIVTHINGYLLDAPDVFVKNRSKSINKGVAKVVQGSPPADDGRLLLTSKERQCLIEKYPELNDVIKPFVGSREFINDTTYSRCCFWFVGKTMSEYRHIPELIERFNYIRTYRQKSPVDRIQKTADIPYLFTQNRQPDADYLIIPRVSSSRRRYIPIGFLSKDVIASDSAVLVYNAGLVEFGLLSSNVHNAWMRVVAGRLKNDYRYAPSVFYNFPLPEFTDNQRDRIKKTAQSILDARSKYSNCCLAEMYGDEMYLFPELLKAHQDNDRAVMAAYGFDIKMTENECVAKLLEMYRELTNVVRL